MAHRHCRGKHTHPKGQAVASGKYGTGTDVGTGRAEAGAKTIGHRRHALVRPKLAAARRAGAQKAR